MRWSRKEANRVNTTDGKVSRNITSFDVARLAGVSQSTVSLVFGGKAAGRVSPVTQKEVLQAAQELGYRPNTVARMLRLGRTNIVALIIPDVGNPFFASVFQGAEQTARLFNHTVVLVNTGNDQKWQHIIVDALTSHAIDGFVLCSVQPPDALDLATLEHRAVIVDRSSTELTSLTLDIVGGSQAALQHLLELGHRKIAHLAANIDAETFTFRQQEYERALEAAGIPARAEYLAHTTFTIENATKAAQTLLSLSDPPTAIFCDDDLLAIGVYKAAKKAGLVIPHDLSVIGFSDGFIAQTLDPELTTIAIPARSIGIRAIELLIAGFDSTQKTQNEVIPLSLLVRESTAAPR